MKIKKEIRKIFTEKYKKLWVPEGKLISRRHVDAPVAERNIKDIYKI